MQSKNRVTDVENKLLVTKGGMESGINWEVGLIHISVLCAKKIILRTSHIAQGTLPCALW